MLLFICFSIWLCLSLVLIIASIIKAKDKVSGFASWIAATLAVSISYDHIRNAEMISSFTFFMLLFVGCALIILLSQFYFWLFLRCRHQWNGCTCEKCGATRDEQHDLDGCTCRRCEKVQHDLDNCKCKRCGAIVHDGCVCSRCGEGQHDWQETGHLYHDVAGGHGGSTIYYTCTICNESKTETGY